MLFLLAQVYLFTLLFSNEAVSESIRFKQGSQCITPDDGIGSCVTLGQCKPLIQAALSGNDSLVELVIKSQCGYDCVPLVCCGSAIGSQVWLSTLLPNLKECGIRSDNDRIKWSAYSSLYKNDKDYTTYGRLPKRDPPTFPKPTSRPVFGGISTEMREHPWAVLLHYKFNNTNADAGFKCGGSLINNRYILTAAHCVRLSLSSNLELDYVRLGTWKTSINENSYASAGIYNFANPVTNVRIEEAIVHPNFHQNSANDIALLRLAQQVQFSGSIKPICLPQQNFKIPEVGTMLTAVGWGVTEDGRQSDVLLKVKIPIFSKENCSRILNNVISDLQICAGGIEGFDTCYGDFGGPLMNTIVENSKQWYLEGIISYGLGCGYAKIPGVYTRVAAFVDWIVETIRK